METVSLTNPPQKVMSVSRKLLSDKYVRDCFQDHLGTQIYVQIASTHVRSQEFGRAICSVIRRMRRKPPKKVDSFIKMFEQYGFRDPAAEHPFLDRPTWRTGTTLSELKEQARRNQISRMQQLMDAAYNTKPDLAWKVSWTE